MPRGKKAAETATTLRNQLEEALEHVTDAAWLAENSPLAAPYLLGEDTASGLGSILQRKLQSAAAQLKSDPDTTYNPQHLLKILYFEPDRSLNQAGLALRMGLSPATFYRHRNDAISDLETSLLPLLSPAIRLEKPIAQTIVGRAAVMSQCKAWLRDGKAISLTGLSGLGKTTLAAGIAQEHTPDATRLFWHTFRGGINDRVSSLIFVLGSFLFRQGSPALWTQLTVNRGVIDPQIALGLAAEALDTKPTLLCFDEMDLLTPRDVEPDEYRRLRQFVATLLQYVRARSGALLIGQTQVLETDEHIRLQTLSLSETRELLVIIGVQPTDEIVETIHQLAEGNPLLIKLLGAMLHGTAKHDEARRLLRTVGRAPSLGVILDRVLRGLSAAESEAFAALSSFPTAAPIDAWSAGKARSALLALAGRGLAQLDERGGVSLTPVLRESLQQQLSPARRIALQRWAGQVRAAHGEYTAAAYHFVQANEPVLAIKTWFPHSEREIASGQAGTALSIFKSLPHTGLDDRDQKTLIVMRSELRQLAGESDSALNELHAAKWSPHDVLSSRAQELMGIFSYTAGDTQAALTAYDLSLQTNITQLEAQRSRLYSRMGLVHLRSRNLDAAWKAAQLAQLEASIFQGSVLIERGSADSARALFETSLSTATMLDAPSIAARAHHHLGVIALRQEVFDEAISHFNLAATFYRRFGDLSRAQHTQSDLAAAYIQANRYQDAIHIAKDALRFFESAGAVYWIDLNLANIAEAYIQLGEIIEAEHYANRSIALGEASGKPYALTTLGLVHKTRGQLDAAETHFRRAIESARDIEDRWAEAPAHRALGQMLFAAGRAEDGRIEIQAALEIYQALRLPKEVARTQKLLEEAS